MPKPKKVKSILRRILRKRSGKRFRYAYSLINQYINNNVLLRGGLLVGSVVLIILGFILLFIPGPGLMLIFLGAALSAATSRTVARWLDKTEKKTQKHIKK